MTSIGPPDGRGIRIEATNGWCPVRGCGGQLQRVVFEHDFQNQSLRQSVDVCSRCGWFDSAPFATDDREVIVKPTHEWEEDPQNWIDGGQPDHPAD